MGETGVLRFPLSPLVPRSFFSGSCDALFSVRRQNAVSGWANLFIPPLFLDTHPRFNSLSFLLKNRLFLLVPARWAGWLLFFLFFLCARRTFYLIGHWIGLPCPLWARLSSPPWIFWSTFISYLPAQSLSGPTPPPPSFDTWFFPFSLLSCVTPLCDFPSMFGFTCADASRLCRFFFFCHLVFPFPTRLPSRLPAFFDFDDPAPRSSSHLRLASFARFFLAIPYPTRCVGPLVFFVVSSQKYPPLAFFSPPLLPCVFLFVVFLVPAKTLRFAPMSRPFFLHPFPW